MLSHIKNIGPGAMVAAAFIGPGTVTTATLSGAGFGYTLLWAVLFSLFATFILQEMAARLGLCGNLGLGEAIRAKIPKGVFKIAAFILVLAAIFIGNAAYEAGNITGAILGFGPKLSGIPFGETILITIIAALAFLLLYSGKYKLIERALVLLVGTMGFIFILAAILSRPDFSQVIQGFFIPRIPERSLIMVMGLIGTTVVPYNLFLHASTVQKKWGHADFLRTSRIDTMISIIIGGMITSAILITSAVVLNPLDREITSAGDLSLQLRPLLGDSAEYFINVGFLAAGLSSAITAPLAAAFAVSGLLGWSSDMRSRKFRWIWSFVLFTGVVFASLGLKPLTVILFAQVANGLLLPIIAGFLLWTLNDANIMGSYKNSKLKNLLGLLVMLIALALGIKSIISAF